LIQKQGKNQQLWAIAEEIVVNATLEDIGGSNFSLPGLPLSPFNNKIQTFNKNSTDEVYYYYDSCGKEKTAYEIYMMLLNDMEKKQFCNGNMGLDCGKKEDGNGNNGKKVILSDDVISVNNTTENIEQKNEIIERANAVVKAIAKKRGSLPLGMDRFIKKLKNESIPYERILINFVATAYHSGSDDINWSRINTRHPLAKDILLPGEVEREFLSPIVGVDTSGSITDEQLSSFASKMAKLNKYVFEYTVITTDAQIHEKVFIKNIKDILTKLKFKGRGGTDFEPFFKEVKKAPFVIFFTDGEANFPKEKPSYPVLWVLTKSHVVPPFGRVAYVDVI